MGWRSVLVSNPAKLSLKNRHLVINQGEETHIPLEDLSVIVVETEPATITSKLLDNLAFEGIPLFTCDPRHLHLNRLKERLPTKGSVRFLQITDRQYAAMKLLIGTRTRKEKYVNSNQMLLF